MINNFIEIMKAVLSLAVAFICLFLSKRRFKENKIYADKYANDNKKLIKRLILTELLRWSGVAIVLGIIINILDAFIAFYILTPIIIGLNIAFFKNTKWILGFMTFIKGIYYLGLTVISTIQYILKIKNISELALGFTLSLAIFETITALSDGYVKMKNSKLN